MKLVDILARELKEWPSEALFAYQDPDKEIRFSHADYDFFAKTLADDCGIDIGIGPKVTRAQWQTAVDALKTDECAVPEWNGKGLPPVGTVCEWAGCTFAPEDPVEPDLHIGDHVTIIAHFKDGEFDLAAFTFNPQVHNLDRGTAWVNQGACGCFRPIRTPEQIAAAEREARLLGMARAYQNSTGLLASNEVLHAFAAIEAEGYRKQESDK